MIPPVLESERLLYVPVSMQHLSQDYVDWLNDKDVYRFLETGGNYSLTMLQDFLLATEAAPKLFWAIHIKENNLHIGNIKIDPINEKHGFGEYGIMMGRKTEWGKGYAFEASQRIINFCFEQLNLRKINLGVVADNTSAVQLYKKLGFNTEGLYKKHAQYDGEYRDILRMAIFNSEYAYENE